MGFQDLFWATDGPTGPNPPWPLKCNLTDQIIATSLTETKETLTDTVFIVRWYPHFAPLLFVVHHFLLSANRCCCCNCSWELFFVFVDGVEAEASATQRSYWIHTNLLLLLLLLNDVLTIKKYLRLCCCCCYYYYYKGKLVEFISLSFLLSHTLTLISIHFTFLKTIIN